MAEPYLGQVEFFGFNFAPTGWLQCNGQLLPISQNTALFSLLGTTYGGNGQSNFALPDLRGRVVVAQGNDWTLGETQGEETHSLLITETPAHSHSLTAVSGQTVSSNAAVPGPTVGLAQTEGLHNGKTTAADVYANDSAPNQVMARLAVTTAGGSQPHSNLMPCLVLTACIATTGIYPSRS